MAVFNNYILMKIKFDAATYGDWRGAKTYVEFVKEYLGMAGISCIYRMVFGEKYTFRLYVSDCPTGASLYDILQDLRGEFGSEHVTFELDLNGNSAADSGDFWCEN
jgi:hypothetical protein